MPKAKSKRYVKPLPTETSDSSSENSDFDNNTVVSNENPKMLGQVLTELAKLKTELTDLKNSNKNQTEKHVTSHMLCKDDTLPVFSAEPGGTTALQWLSRLEYLADIYSWDEQTKIFNLTTNLAGNAKLWFEYQTETNLSWTEWKRKLINAFPSGYGVAALLRDKYQNNVICHTCKRRGHYARNCHAQNEYTSLFCTHCNRQGHTREKCYKINRSKNKFKEEKSVLKILTTDPDNEKYFVNVYVNGKKVTGYVDTGSPFNFIRLDVVKQLNLQLIPAQNISFRGYGGPELRALGEVNIELRIDEIVEQVRALVVPNYIQQFDILIGRTFTEISSLCIIKMPDAIHFERFYGYRELPQIIESTPKIKLYSNYSSKISQGVNKISVVTPAISNGQIKIEHSTRSNLKMEVFIPEQNLEIASGQPVLTIINHGATFNIRSNEVVARAQENLFSKNNIIMGDHLTEVQKSSVIELVQNYHKCFAQDLSQLGETDVELSIKLTSDIPFYHQPYRLSFHERKQLQNIIDELLNYGIIEQTTSPYASPVILVKKKSGELRMCVDYRKLNSITVKDRYPLPVIEDQLMMLSNQKYFTTLDLTAGYHQVKVAKDSKPLTAFITPDGHYQYRRMPFGLANAPSVFQKVINKVMGSLRYDFVLAYLDDILVYSSTYEEGIERLKLIFEILSQANLTLRLNKCKFLMSSVEYLGHEISHGSLKPSKLKIKAVQQFNTPKNVHEARQFIGLSSYFRKFIKNYATIVQPITKLTKKNQSWIWGKEQEVAFREIKTILTSEPVLALYDPNRPIQIHTDASKLGLGAILLQQYENDWKPVIYMSRQTSEPEQRYHSFELETLAVVEAIRKFRIYIVGTEFTIITDCNAVRATWEKKDLTPRIGRWYLELQEYNFKIECRPGTKMLHVDALSRNPVLHISENDWVDVIQADDYQLRELRNQIENGQTDGTHILCEGKICRLINNEPRIVLPKSVRFRVLRMHHDDNGHPCADRVIQSIKSKYWFPKMRRFVIKYIRSCISCMYAKKPTGPKPGELHPIPKGNVPFYTLHVDHLGPFCKSNSNNTHILVIIDGFSKFVWIQAVPDTSSKFVIETFETLGKLVKFPERIISDRGKCFTSQNFKDFCTIHNIKHVLNAVASPRSNGQVERMNRTI